MAKFIVSYRSDRKSHREVRRIVKALLRKGIEPVPKYSTGKFWTD